MINLTLDEHFYRKPKFARKRTGQSIKTKILSKHSGLSFKTIFKFSGRKLRSKLLIQHSHAIVFPSVFLILPRTLKSQLQALNL